jgi:hypothetical protein
MYGDLSMYLLSARQGGLILVCSHLPANQKIKIISVFSVLSVV